MAQIRDFLLKTAVFLYPNREDAEAGKNNGGSAFVVGVPILSSPGKLFPYVVTCAHNLEGFENCAIRVNLVREIDGTEYRVIETKTKDWFHHPDESNDVAIYPLHHNAVVDLVALNIERWFLSHEDITEYSIGPGQETFTIGRFINHEGFVKNLPAVRSGNISMMPLEPVLHRGRSQESYLVETRSNPGYSGSPVFVHVLPFSQSPNLDDPKKTVEQNVAENMLISYHDWLLGLDCGILPSRKDNPQYHTGMMAVLPTWKILEVLMHPRVKKKREILDNLIQKMKDKGVKPSAESFTVQDMRDFLQANPEFDTIDEPS